jgi:hypothetical protein
MPGRCRCRGLLVEDGLAAVRDGVAGDLAVDQAEGVAVFADEEDPVAWMIRCLAPRTGAGV